MESPAPAPECPVCAAGSAWHARVAGGVLFGVLGTDYPNFGYCAGLDVGHTFPSGFGVDAFYRVQFLSFERSNDPTLTRDGGHFQHLGMKLTYETDHDSGARVGVYGGIGPTYTWSDNFQSISTGIGGFGEAGVSWRVFDRVHLRFGVEAHAFQTDVGRYDIGNDGHDRWVYTVAPVIGVEFDF
jgi:hypothetical protein